MQEGNAVRYTIFPISLSVTIESKKKALLIVNFENAHVLLFITSCSYMAEILCERLYMLSSWLIMLAASCFRYRHGF